MKFEFGGNRAFKTFPYKSFLLSLEWDEIEDGEPILIIHKNNAILQIGLSSAVMWADPSGKPTDQAFIRSAGCAEMFGFEVSGLSMADVIQIAQWSRMELSPSAEADRDERIARILAKSPAIREIVDCVMHGIPDLLRMPKVRPEAGPKAGIEMTMKLNDKVIREALV